MWTSLASYADALLNTTRYRRLYFSSWTLTGVESLLRLIHAVTAFLKSK